MDKSVQFLKNAILGENIGAVARSSKYVVKKVLSFLNQTQISNIIEYGPGDGVLTRELLKILPANGKNL